MTKTNHDPRWKYDCDRCKFHWCCGAASHCGLYDKPEPPEERKLEVDAVLVKLGYRPQYYGKGAQRR